MPLPLSFVRRENPASGDQFLMGSDGSGRLVQALMTVDDNGNHNGISGKPYYVTDVVPAAFVYGTAATAELSAVIATSARTLRGIRCILDGTASVPHYLMLFDRTTAPTTGLTPKWRAHAPAYGEAAESFSTGLVFSTGIVAAVSTTIGTYTAPSAANAFYHAISH